MFGAGVLGVWVQGNQLFGQQYCLWGQSNKVKGTDVGKGRARVQVVAKGQEDSTCPQLRGDFISMNCAQGQKEMGWWRGLGFLKYVYEKNMMAN